MQDTTIPGRLDDIARRLEDLAGITPAASVAKDPEITSKLKRISDAIASTGGALEAHNLGDHLDTEFIDPTAGDVIQWDGDEFVLIAEDALLSLADLTDVADTLAPSGSTDAEVLRWDGTEWDSANVGITELSDVAITGIANEDVLQYDSGSSTWVNVDITTFAGTLDHGSLDGLTDQADHTWALTIDGSRPLTANWAAGSFTISSNVLQVLSNSDTLTFTHDGTDAYIRTSDGWFYLQTDEGTNTDSIFAVKGKGSGRAKCNFYDQSANNYFGLVMGGGNAYWRLYHVTGTALGDIYFQNVGGCDISFFYDAVSGETPQFILGGFRTGDSLRRAYLSTGATYDDTLTFGGVSSYFFDGDIRVNDSDKLILGTAGAADSYLQWDGAGIDLYSSGGIYDFNAAANTDITLNFIGTTSSGVIRWMEDEDEFQFDDDVMILADSKKLALGAAGAADSYIQWNGSDNDLEIYSAGGGIDFHATAETFAFYDDSNSYVSLGFSPTGGTSGVIVWDGLIRLFSFSSSLALLADNRSIIFGEDSDAGIAWDGSQFVIKSDNGVFYFSSDGIGTDITFSFKGTTNSGVFYWMDTEDYFKFADDVLVDAAENLYFRDTGLHINSSADGELDITTDGNITLGDGGTTNYANFAADGELSLIGTARVRKEFPIGAVSIAPGVTGPDAVILGNYYGLQFEIDETATADFEIPHDWDSTTNLTFTIYWYINEAYATGSGEVQWSVAWSATPTDGSEAVDAPTHSGTLDFGDQDIPATAKYLTASSTQSIAAASLAVGDVVGITVSRVDLDDGSDPTAHPVIVRIEVGYVANKLGEAT